MYQSKTSRHIPTAKRLFLKTPNCHLIKHLHKDIDTIHKSLSCHFLSLSHTHTCTAAQTLSPPSISALCIWLKLLMHVPRSCTLSKGPSWARGHALLNTSGALTHTHILLLGEGCGAGSGRTGAQTHTHIYSSTYTHMHMHVGVSVNTVEQTERTEPELGQK